MHANLFHFGHLHIPVFSAFAAVGLIAAVLLSQRTAPFAGLRPQAMWDTAVLAALSAFVISRLLLIATNLKSFLAYPLLILSLPSLTFSGVLLTALVLWFILRRRNLPALRVLDAAAAPLALLWAIVSVGSFATGSVGIPTRVPWAIQDRLLGAVHPVEVYTALAAFTLAGVLYALLTRPGAAATPGLVAGTGSFLAGGIAFLLDFFAQPADSSRIVLLDPVQWLALFLILTGSFLLVPHLAHPGFAAQPTPAAAPGISPHAL